MRYDLDELELDFADAVRLRKTLHAALNALSHYDHQSDYLEELGLLYAGAMAAEAAAFNRHDAKHWITEKRT